MVTLFLKILRHSLPEMLIRVEYACVFIGVGVCVLWTHAFVLYLKKDNVIK